METTPSNASSIFLEKRQLRYLAWLILILVGSSVLLCRHLSQPWNGLDGPDGALFSSIARNYLRYGFVTLRLGQARNAEPVRDLGELSYYHHHPPLLPTLIAGSFKLFGESEASARLVPVTCALGSILLVFAIARRTLSIELAILTTFLFAFSPAVLFFGRKPGYEAPTLFFILAALWIYDGVCNKPRLANLLTLFAVVAAGLLTDWPAYFLVPALSLHYWTQQRAGPYRAAVCFGLPALALGVFALTVTLYWMASPADFLSLFYQCAAYMGFIAPTSPLASKYTEAALTFSVSEYARRIGRHVDQLFAYPVILLAIVGVIAAVREKVVPKPWALATLSVIAAANWLFFWRSAFFHIWWFYYFAAPIALLAAIGAASVILPADQTPAPRGETRRQLGTAFLIGLVLVGSLPRLIDLHAIERRLLPDTEFEGATLAPELAAKIAALTKPDDRVITNLSANLFALQYYMRRCIVLGIGDVEALRAAAVGLPEGSAHFLYWRPAGDKTDSALLDWLQTHGVVTRISVQRQEFLWFTIRTPDLT